MTLLEECIQALGESAKIIKQEEAELLINTLQDTYPFTPYSRINWDGVYEKVKIKFASEINKHINLESSVYILWDNAKCPVIQIKLKNALEVIDDVTAVSFDTWLFNPSEKFIIEFHHDGNITIGLS